MECSSSLTKTKDFTCNPVSLCKLKQTSLHKFHRNQSAETLETEGDIFLTSSSPINKNWVCFTGQSNFDHPERAEQLFSRSFREQDPVFIPNGDMIMKQARKNYQVYDNGPRGLFQVETSRPTTFIHQDDALHLPGKITAGSETIKEISLPLYLQVVLTVSSKETEAARCLQITQGKVDGSSDMKIKAESPDERTCSKFSDGTIKAESSDERTCSKLSDGTIKAESPDGMICTDSSDGTIKAGSPQGMICSESSDGTLKAEFPVETKCGDSSDGTIRDDFSDGTLSAGTLSEGTIGAD